MKKLMAAAIALSLLAGCYGPKIDMSTLKPGMTKQEVTRIVGRDPESAKFQNGFSYLFYKVRDGAFGNYTNRYIFAFANEKLVEFAPLPPEEGLIDKALRIKASENTSFGSLNTNLGNSTIITPDAYGPGIHMDQYGRPVKVVPR